VLSQRLFVIPMLVLCWGVAIPLAAAEIPLEESPQDPKQAKIVLIAGSNFFQRFDKELKTAAG